MKNIPSNSNSCHDSDSADLADGVDFDSEGSLSDDNTEGSNIDDIDHD